MAEIRTHIDELIDYPARVINAIAESEAVAKLVLNKSVVNFDGDDADEMRSRLYDYDYIDDTVQEEKALIMVDCDLVRSDSPTVNIMEVYVQVVVNKNYMRLDSEVFPGIKGNRRDNISRQIDLLLNGRKDFGIGRLQLMNARTATVPKKFTSKLLTYSVSDYGVDRGLWRD